MARLGSTRYALLAALTLGLLFVGCGGINSTRGVNMITGVLISLNADGAATHTMHVFQTDATTGGIGPRTDVEIRTGPLNYESFKRVGRFMYFITGNDLTVITNALMGTEETIVRNYALSVASWHPIGVILEP